jgi:hypothetical protein
MTYMLSQAYLLAWLRAFLFTQVVEMPIYMRYAPSSKVRAFGASAVTHPFVWFVFPLLGTQVFGTRASYAGVYLGSELFAWLVEALVMRAPAGTWLRAMSVSLLANAASVALGETSRYFFGYP